VRLGPGAAQPVAEQGEVGEHALGPHADARQFVPLHAGDQIDESCLHSGGSIGGGGDEKVPGDLELGLDIVGVAGRQRCDEGGHRGVHVTVRAEQALDQEVIVGEEAHAGPVAGRVGRVGFIPAP
jgi:hypothetical protein